MCLNIFQNPSPGACFRGPTIKYGAWKQVRTLMMYIYRYDDTYNFTYMHMSKVLPALPFSFAVTVG